MTDLNIERSPITMQQVDMERAAIITPRNIAGYAAAVAGVAAVTALYRLVITGVNHTTVGLSFLLVVLLVSSSRGLASGILASVAGLLCFNFFFLPPAGTLTIEDPQNWIALLAFLVTAVITSQLSATARSRANEAERRREELLELYQLSQSIIANPDPETALPSIARQVVNEFDADYCAVFAKESGDWIQLGVATSLDQYQMFMPPIVELDAAFSSGETSVSALRLDIDDHPRARKLSYASLKFGVKSIGVIALVSSSLEQRTMEAIAALVALAVERTRFLKEVSRTEALRQSDELKSALLASVSHDLRTPLTSMRAAVESLLQQEAHWDEKALREFHLIISEDLERLTRVVQNLLQMARIEAGELRPTKEWTTVSDIVDSVLDRCRNALSDHLVFADVDEALPLVKVDSLLVAQALSHLVENAAKYSPAGKEIRVGAKIEEGSLIVSVEDQGVGIPPEETGRIFDRFYRGSSKRVEQRSGTGMGLSISRGIVDAHGGRISAESSPGRGATFTIAIPAEIKETALLLHPEGTMND